MGTADIAQPLLERIAVADKGARPHGPDHVETAGIRVVRHRRPIRAADPRRLDQHRLFPKDLEDAAGFFVAACRHGLGTLRHDRVADRERLRLRGLLPRLLRHRTLLDADQRLAVGAVEDVDPAGTASLGDALARLAVDHRVEQDDRARRIVVPDVVVHLLVVPGIGAGLGVDREDRGAEQIVAFAHRSVVIRPAIADGKVDEAELRIERRGVPDRRPAA